MQSRFEDLTTLATRFDAVLGKMDESKKLIGKSKVTPKFIMRQEKINSRDIVDRCLRDLETYKENILKLAEDELNKENKKYYQAHFEAFVEMLEKVINGDFIHLEDKDYQVVVPKEFPYQKPPATLCKDMVVNGAFGAGFGLISTLFAYAMIIAGLALWVGLAVTFPVALIGTGPLLFYVMPIVTASVGLILGSAIGATLGYYEKTSYQEDLDLDNSSTLRLLKKANNELNDVSLVREKNKDEEIEQDLSYLILN